MQHKRLFPQQHIPYLWRCSAQAFPTFPGFFDCPFSKTPLSQVWFMVETTFYPQENPMSHSPKSCRRFFCSESRLRSCLSVEPCYESASSESGINSGNESEPTRALTELLPDFQKSKKSADKKVCSEGPVVKPGWGLEEYDRKRDVKGTWPFGSPRGLPYTFILSPANDRASVRNAISQSLKSAGSVSSTDYQRPDPRAQIINISDH